MGQPSDMIKLLLLLCGILPLSTLWPESEVPVRQRRPNILFAIADDHSFPHASAYGSRMFRTPNFDRVAAEGVLFYNAFVAAPQCSPSRASILTGRNIWQLEEAGTHSSYFPSKFPVFTDALEGVGYAIGYTGKAWDPGNWEDAGRSRNPVGPEYNSKRFPTVPSKGISAIDYAANFEDFLSRKTSDQPFFFWYGAHEPHRVYEAGSGQRDGFETVDAEIPAFLPKDSVVRRDMEDYAHEIGWFDRQLGRMIELLEQRGELDNTIIIVTADNGMAYPYAKANLQEFGTHVPLAIRGPFVQGRGRKVQDLVSLADIAPTVLEAAGAAPMAGMSARSIMPVLSRQYDAKTDPARNFVVTGRERHTHARPDNLGYPARALRDGRFLYIRNLKPDRWPAGDPPPESPSAGPLPKGMKPIVEGYEDIDASPVKSHILRNKKTYTEAYGLGYTKRPAEQLFDIIADPGCTRDLAGQRDHHTIQKRMAGRLDSVLKAQGDPRVTGRGDVFETYPRFGGMRPFPGFREQGKYNQ
jgi:uncharacterized sulfatase